MCYQTYAYNTDSDQPGYERKFCYKFYTEFQFNNITNNYETFNSKNP